MKQLFRFVSMCWIISPVIFAVSRMAGKVNVENQNVTIFIVLSAVSYIALFLNSDSK